MDQIVLETSTMQTCVGRAANVLTNGGVILYPTDTLYGLGADAFSDAAVDKVYEIKGRDEEKPIHCIVADIGMAKKYADFTSDALLLANQFFPGPLTLILKKKQGIEGGIGRELETIGIRIPRSDFCMALAEEFGRPFTATSANVSGLPHLHSIEAICMQLGDAADDIDLAVDAGDVLSPQPSTVVDLGGEEPVILREGAIPAADIWNVIRLDD